MKNEKYVVPAIDNAAKIIEYLAREVPQGKSLSEISDASGLNPSTCFRLLHALQKYNVVSYHESDKTFTLGFYLKILGQKVGGSINLEKAQRFLEKASLITKQTCVLSQRFSEDKVIYIAKQESNNDYRINVNLGQTRNIHTTSTGKCFLAYLDEEEVKKIIDYMGGVKKLTKYSVKNEPELWEQIKGIQEFGYSISEQETILGVCGVAAPVFDNKNHIRFVLSVHCFCSQVNKDLLHSYGKTLKDIASQMSSSIFPTD
jgi:IclR family transcriptional regulator, KDG regulon repressor